MIRSVMIIGGYGEVGGNIARQLVQSTDLRVLIAGRRLEKAASYCKQLGPSAHPVEIDVQEPSGFNVILEAELVIMCMDQQSTILVEYCLEHHIHYVDITANYSFHRQVERLEARGSTVMMSVGFSPGLSNLLAQHLVDHMGTMEQLHIIIMLGLGEKHGAGAIEWLLDQMTQTYHVQQDAHSVRNFTGRKITYFNRLGRRSSYLFNFADQHILQRKLPHTEVRTYLTLDVEWVNRLLAIVHRLRITSLLRYNWIKQGLIKLIQACSSVPTSSDICAIKVEAMNGESKQINEMQHVLYGNNEAMMTAYVTTLVVKQLMQSALPVGIYHIDDLFCFGAGDAKLDNLRMRDEYLSNNSN